MVVGSTKNKNNSKYPAFREEIKYENPEKFYEFGDEIGSPPNSKGKMSIVKVATSKVTGQKYAAKMIYFDDDVKFAIREYDLMAGGKLRHKGLVKMHEAYMVRKYLIIIMDLVDGKTLLDQFSSRISITEDDVCQVVRDLCLILDDLHQQNVVHLDIRPTNMRFQGRDIKLLDYNSARHLANKKAGAVVDIIGDTEFCAPEMLNFDPVLPGSDMWSVAVITYILLSGISPFYHADEALVLQSVQSVKYTWDDAFQSVTTEAKEFIKKCFIRAPEMRMTAEDALKHPWFSADLESKRKKVAIKIQDTLTETDTRLLGEEEEEYVEASYVYRTFEEEEYDSPEDDSEEE